VRILSGDLYNRAFDRPKTDGTRPLTDKVRAAIFDVTGSPEGLTVLDAYAGTFPGRYASRGHRGQQAGGQSY
jgi:16S rRNA G966 N2-methylase RsmD